PVLAVLGALLAAADPLFATFLEPDLRLTSAVTWICLFVVGVASAAFVVRIADSDPTAVSQAGQPLSLGKIESLCLLSGVTVLFLAYVAVQGMAALGLGEQSLAAQGLSVAEYARSGYFQLLAVVFLTSMVLITVDGTRGGRSHTRPSERILFAVIVLLTLVIEIVALRRLLLYVDSFGLTMLRLACLAAAVWMAALLVLICASVLGAKSRKRWLPAGVTMAFIVTSFAFAVLNPEALVVSYNVHHPHDTPIDLDYVASLSDDAVPALVDALDELGPAEAAYLQAQLCERSAQSPGVLGWSFSRQQAANALAIACPPGSNSMVAGK
ncbi:MAG: DUF4173 domain-containing protein, partial [Actinomycetes bacterium]